MTVVELLEPSQLSRELREGTSDDMQRRRWGLALTFVGVAMGVAVGLYQTGVVKRLPDILPGDIWDAEKVDASDYAYAHGQQPDAPAMIANYGLTAMALAAGGENRAEQNPALPLLAAAKAASDFVACVALARAEWRDNRKFCSYCQVATLVSGATLVLALPEAGRAVRALRD
jgi:uncharacterized membrane protein